MRITRIACLLTVILALTACRGHEAITGSYGAEGVSGVVTMATGMSNSNPAGVRVTVGGTGMSAVLATDGRFSFFGVPETADLIFSRGDLNAHVRVTASPVPLLIELNSNAASVGRHRTAPSVPLLEIEGVIGAITATGVTVHDSHNQDVTVKITTDTIIRKGDQTLQPADLHVGDHVHVQAKVSGDETTAVIITLQNPDGEDEGSSSQTMTANGTVKATGASELTVTTVPKGDVVVKVDGSTVIKKESDRIALTDIHVGDEVNTLGTRIDDHTLRATQIEVRGVSGRH
jgi:hypothetical protein